MATVKVVLKRENKKNDGTCPITIRITKDRKTKYCFTNYAVLEKHWNLKANEVAKAHPNSTRLNNFLAQRLAEAKDVILEAEQKDPFITANDLRKKVERLSIPNSFFDFASERIRNKHLAGTFSVAQSERAILYNLKEFIEHDSKKARSVVIAGIQERRKQRISTNRKNKPDFIVTLNKFSNCSLGFEQINSSFINGYKAFCAAYLGQKQRTINNQLIFIRTLYNLAIKEGLVGTKHYPFGGDNEQIKLSAGLKIGLTREEVEQIENLACEPNSQLWHTKNVWLFAYYFAGIRISDVLKLQWSDFQDDRLYYVMNKNAKPVSLKVPAKALEILEYYRPQKRTEADVVFPYLKQARMSSKEDVFRKSRNAISLLNKYLQRIAVECGIEKSLSNHIARHTFGNIAGDKIHPMDLQKLYRHSDLKTTINYQNNFIHKSADEALDAVLNG